MFHRKSSENGPKVLGKKPAIECTFEPAMSEELHSIVVPLRKHFYDFLADICLNSL